MSAAGAARRSWRSVAELAQLKEPDVDLDPDLLRRTRQAPGWDDHASVLRRILPQLASALVNGTAEARFGLAEAGRSLARGQRQRWPAEQATAVREFLEAWWAHSLSDPDPVVPAHEVLALCVEASGTLSPWLRTWEALTLPAADQRLAEAIARWQDDLLRGELPSASRAACSALTGLRCRGSVTLARLLPRPRAAAR